MARAECYIALSESLSGELASFNIRVLLVVPGRFRKNILNANADQLLAPSEAYKGTIVDQVHQNFIRQSGKQPGDPEKAAQRIFEAVTGTGMGEGKGEFLRVILGKGC